MYPLHLFNTLMLGFYLSIAPVAILNIATPDQMVLVWLAVAILAFAVNKVILRLRGKEPGGMRDLMLFNTFWYLLALGTVVLVLAHHPRVSLEEGGAFYLLAFALVLGVFLLIRRVARLLTGD